MKKKLAIMSILKEYIIIIYKEQNPEKDRITFNGTSIVQANICSIMMTKRKISKKKSQDYQS
jgi:hypothetical protein